MAAPYPPFDLPPRTASSDEVCLGVDPASTPSLPGSDRNALLRDLIRALAREAAREAWARAMIHNSLDQEKSS